jgi:hypothetical protein
MSPSPRTGWQVPANPWGEYVAEPPEGGPAIHFGQPFVELLINVERDLLQELVDGLEAAINAFVTAAAGDVVQAIRDLASALESLLDDDSKSIILLWTSKFTADSAVDVKIGHELEYDASVSARGEKSGRVTWKVEEKVALNGSKLGKLRIDKAGTEASGVQTETRETTVQAWAGENRLRITQKMSLSGQGFSDELTALVEAVADLAVKAANINAKVQEYMAGVLADYVDSVWDFFGWYDQDDLDEMREAKRSQLEKELKAEANAATKALKAVAKELLNKWKGDLRVINSSLNLALVAEAETSGMHRTPSSGTSVEEKLEETAEAVGEMREALLEAPRGKLLRADEVIPELLWTEMGLKGGDYWMAFGREDDRRILAGRTERRLAAELEKPDHLGGELVSEKLKKRMAAELPEPN